MIFSLFQTALELLIRSATGWSQDYFEVDSFSVKVGHNKGSGARAWNDVAVEVFPGTNDPAGKFQIDPFGLGMLINGLTSNTNDQGKILEMWAGEGCQRFPVS